MNQRIFEIKIMYFKPSGKYYSESNFTGMFSNCGDELLPSCYMSDVADLVKRQRDGHSMSGLPGLQSGTWDGPILIDCDDGFPVLILPQRSV